MTSLWRYAKDNNHTEHRNFWKEPCIRVVKYCIEAPRPNGIWFTNSRIHEFKNSISNFHEFTSDREMRMYRNTFFSIFMNSRNIYSFHNFTHFHEFSPIPVFRMIGDGWNTARQCWSANLDHLCSKMQKKKISIIEILELFQLPTCEKLA